MINIEYYKEGLQQEVQFVSSLEGLEGLLEEAKLEKDFQFEGRERGSVQTFMQCLGNEQERVVEYQLMQEGYLEKWPGSWIAAQLSRVFNAILGINYLGKNGQLKSF